MHCWSLSPHVYLSLSLYQVLASFSSVVGFVRATGEVSLVPFVAAGLFVPTGPAYLSLYYPEISLSARLHCDRSDDTLVIHLRCFADVHTVEAGGKRYIWWSRVVAV